MTTNLKVNVHLSTGVSNYHQSEFLIGQRIHTSYSLIKFTMLLSCKKSVMNEMKFTVLTSDEHYFLTNSKVIHCFTTDSSNFIFNK